MNQRGQKERCLTMVSLQQGGTAHLYRNKFGEEEGAERSTKLFDSMIPWGKQG